MITNTHLKTHKMTVDNYRLQFSEASLVSEEERERASVHAKKINVKGSKRDPVIGQKQSETKRRKFASGELVAWNKGKEMSTEQRQKLSSIVTEAYASGSRVHWNLGRICPDEVRDKITESCKGYKFTDEQRQKIIDFLNSNHPKGMLGKHHSDKVKQKISSGQLLVKDKTRATMEAKGYWIPLDMLDDFSFYKRSVWIETNKNTHLIPNYDETKRGRNQLGQENYQVDHIVSITDGFKQGVDPEIIGSGSNLRFIPWQQNLAKWYRSEMSIEELYELFESIL